MNSKYFVLLGGVCILSRSHTMFHGFVGFLQPNTHVCQCLYQTANHCTSTQSVPCRCVDSASRKLSWCSSAGITFYCEGSAKQWPASVFQRIARPVDVKFAGAPAFRRPRSSCVSRLVLFVLCACVQTGPV